MTQTKQIIAAAPAAKISDKFSWRRVWMVARYWWPHLRPVFLIYVGILIFSGVVAGFVDKENFFSLSFLLALGTYMSLGMSAQFGTNAGRDLSITLPARNSEKMTFMILYSLILVPLLAFIDDVIYELICDRAFYESIPFQTNGMIQDIKPVFMHVSRIYSTTVTMATISTCLYFAVMSRKNAVMRGIGFAVAVFFTLSFVMGLLAGICGFIYGANSALENTVLDEKDIMKEVFDLMVPIFYATSVLATAWTGIMIYRFVKRFPKRQGI